LADQPDWTRATLLQARDAAGNIVTLLVDADGQLYSLLRGEDALGDPQTIQVDADGQLFVVLRGADGVDVAVDADGFLSALLIGEHAGVPHTISVDADGRIEAFVLDSEDQWGSILRIGNAEAAARGGSLMAYDWRGHVLVQNDFARGLGNGYTTVVGAGSSVGLDPEYAVHGGYTVFLSAAAGAGNYARLAAVYGRNPSDRIGLEIGYSALDYGIGTYLQIGMLVQDGVRRWLGRIKIVASGGHVYYWGDDAAWHDKGVIRGSMFPHSLAFVKLVVDAATGHYVRLLVNGVETDLSEYAMDSDMLGFSNTTETEMAAYAAAGVASSYYIDYYTMTLDEP